MFKKEQKQEKKRGISTRPSYISVIALVVVLAGVVGWTAFSFAQNEVTIQADGEEIHHKTFKRTVGELLTEADLQLGEYDQVTPGVEEPLTKGIKVVVERAFPVYLEADGNMDTLYTTGASVKEMMELAALDLGEMDKVEPALDAKVSPECKICVTRVSEETITEAYSIPNDSERKADSSMAKGQQRVLNEGTPGKGERHIQVVYEDGKEASRKTIREKVLKKPVNKVVAYGTASSVSRGGKVINFRKSIQMRSTAYGPSAGTHTATGHRVAKGMVAVDPRVIPLGTRVYVEGYGYATALDVGGAIKGNRIDVYLPSDSECRRWGVRSVKVYVL